jgi:hypothetical protein
MIFDDHVIFFINNKSEALVFLLKNCNGSNFDNIKRPKTVSRMGFTPFLLVCENLESFATDPVCGWCFMSGIAGRP